MTDAAARLPTDTEAGPEVAGLRVSVSGESAGGDATPRPASRKRLVRLLLAKAAADLLLVCALAAGVHRAALRQSFSGALERADAGGVRGWVVDESEPGRRVEVYLYLDGRLAATAVADRAFAFELGPQPPGEREARVYVLNPGGDGRRRTLQQIGDAKKFIVEREGE